MSGFSAGSFSFSRSSGRRGGLLGGHSHSSGRHMGYGHRGHARHRGRRRGMFGCLGVVLAGVVALGGVVGLFSLIA
ncbi:hypothetical protein [Deinococcus aquatilis]|uniref:hypothetical protein n=1 Tax=Deinococcus aquatilis TaxID=519440 RepID=UPI0009FB95AD|nr:hypothetical protein [Deinococcus aquatilis]